ncbi:MAG: hypothetical protein M3Y55_04035, partial [Pseudomonadota bacterium]|nr:hypothetical protein [Pseudomonadota bacterium]
MALGFLPLAARLGKKIWRAPALLLLALCATTQAQAPALTEPTAQTLVIEHALSVAGPQPRYPSGDQAMSVALPDDWSQTRPGYSGSVWYRV